MALADAILVKLREGIIPTVKYRDPHQRWIFLNDESPKHAFTWARKQLNLAHLANIFNWSMTYRYICKCCFPLSWRFLSNYFSLFALIRSYDFILIRSLAKAL